MHKQANNQMIFFIINDVMFWMQDIICKPRFLLTTPIHPHQYPACNEWLRMPFISTRRHDCNIHLSIEAELHHLLIQLDIIRLFIHLIWGHYSWKTCFNPGNIKPASQWLDSTLPLMFLYSESIGLMNSCRMKHSLDVSLSILRTVCFSKCCLKALKAPQPYRINQNAQRSSWEQHSMSLILKRRSFEAPLLLFITIQWFSHMLRDVGWSISNCTWYCDILSMVSVVYLSYMNHSDASLTPKMSLETVIQSLLRFWLVQWETGDECDRHVLKLNLQLITPPSTLWYLNETKKK